MSGSNTEFILVQFNQTITLDISATFDTSYVEIGSYDAMCEVDICLNEWANCFKITSDSEDINNIDASDITYYVYNTSNAGGIKGIESLEMNVNSQTNIEVDLDLIEDLYQWFPFIFSDFYLKKQ